MKNKKGLSLIELLAIIVVISMIIVMVIFKMIDSNNSKNNVPKSSEKLLKENIRNQVLTANIHKINKFNKDGECYLFDFDEDINGNVKLAKISNKDDFTGSIQYCPDGFRDDFIEIRKED